MEAALGILIVVVGIISIGLILTPNDKIDDVFKLDQLDEDEKRRQSERDKRKGQKR
jgi:hypothetical protein